METILMKDGVLASIKWYYECKQYARAKILSFKPQVDLFELRFYYTLYFVNLLSTIEYVHEFVDHDFKPTLQARLVLLDCPDGRNNLRYISALRNALVHRGEDIAGRGSVVNGLVVVHAPEEVMDRENKEIKYRKSFGYYILDIIVLCEAIIGPTIFEFLTKHKLFDAIDESSARQNYLDDVEASDMPDFAKELAGNAFEYGFYLEANQLRRLSVREMLFDTQIPWPRDSA
jgi:hypothetical protein